MLEFVGRVAVVTGAASGIGLGLAEKFGAEGMKVVLADIEKDDLDQAVKGLHARGYEATGVVTDVSKKSDIEVLAQKTLDTYGAVHILCNNAGVTSGGTPLWECSVKDWEWIISVNLWGVIWGIRTFIPIMLAQDTECHVVNTSSMAGLLQGFGIYGVTKHGVVALSESIYGELTARGSKIGISVLLPGVTQTNIWDSARHRPTDLVDPDAVPNPAIEEALRGMRESGRPFGGEQGQTPSLLAEKVLDCIRKNRFWVVPNERYRQPVVQRAEAAFDGTNPVPLTDALTGFPESGW